MIDTIVAGATILDGCAGQPFVTDVAIVGDRIALLGNLADREAVERVGGTGLALAPGFIDVHSHSDELWLVDPRCAGKIAQGVTTEIGGNCGRAAAPRAGDEPSRKTFDAFFSAIDRGGVAVNVASLVGLGTTRHEIHGDRAGRLDDAALVAQAALVRAGVEQGALGVSSGLVYAPSRFADPDELVALASAARDAGGARYVTHLRNEGDALLEAVGEAVEIGRRADVAVQCSHHKAWGKPNWGKVHRSLAAIDRARSRGQRVYADVYPYVAAWTDLTTLLREPALDGGRAQILARLRDPAHAAAIGLLLELDHAGEWHDIRITSVAGDRNAAVVGMRIDELARWWSLPPARAVIRLLVEEELDVEALFFAMNEDDVATVLSAEFVCVGSDASAIAVDGPTARGLPHPRAFGCFPRVLSRFVRGRKTLALPEAIRRMTALPAEIFGLRDRGRIVAGAYADLVLFDPERIVDTATYERPFAYPHGIAGVWVNGVRALRDGAQTPARAGRVLRHGG